MDFWLSQMDRIIVIKPEELQEMIDAAVRKALQSVMIPQTEAVTWMNMDQASAFLKLAKPTIYQKVSRMDIPVYKKGKYLRFLKSDLEAWLKEGRRKTRKEIQRDAGL